MTVTRILSFCAFLLAAPPAFADAVPPPPMDCPAGAVGETGHNGPYCRPTVCASEADCKFWDDKRPRVCRPQSLCVEDVTEPSDSGWSHGRPVTRTFAHATCGTFDKCDKGSCVEASRCVLADAVPPPPKEPPTSPPTSTSADASSTPATSQPSTKPSSGCGCTGAPEVSAGLAFVATAFWLLVGRRRQPRA